MNKLYDYKYFMDSKKFQLNKARANRLIGIIRARKPKKVLDVGCGIGHIVRELNRLGIDAVGLDFATTLKENFWKDGPFVLGDAKELPFKDNSFDLVFSSDFFEHLSRKDIDIVVEEMKRVGGTVITDVAFNMGGELSGRQRKYHITHERKGWWEKKLKGIETINIYRLEIGSGKRPHKGYTTVDIEESANPDILGDFRTMHFNSLEVIRAHHLLEHFSREESKEILEMWYKWLRPGGTLIVETPDFGGICKEFNKDKYWMSRHAYGSQEAGWAFHKSGWWEERFKEILPEIGFNVEVVKESVSRKILPNITVIAIK